MMKPDWKDAPPWAQFLAMDRDGEWYWFELEPCEGDESWLRPYGTGNVLLAARDLPWRDTLEPRP